MLSSDVRRSERGPDGVARRDGDGTPDGDGRRTMSGFDFVLLFIVAAFAGGWTIPVGIELGLNGIGVYLATASGAITGSIVFLSILGRWRDRLFDRHFADAERQVAESRAGEVLDRWGVAGLAIAGTTIIGPTIAQLAVLVLGIDRTRFLIWFVAATLVVYAGLTAFWVAILR